MDLELWRLLIDTGLFILIWIVQLVVYPGFCFYSEAQMKQWHSIYKVQISIVVLPLMVSQLALYAYFFFMGASILNGLLLALVAMTWLVTFLISVPLHDKIENESDSTVARKKLVNTNWIRTGLWSIILIISYIEYAK
jgi:hypothetical protein